MQRSDSFRLGALLSFSGGLQDAYTYNIRGNVFANAQTGNIVLMSQNFMMGNWYGGIEYLLSVLAFIAGVFLSEFIEGWFKYLRVVHWRQIVLIIEILILFLVGLMPPEYETAANMIVSFSCAMQVHSFRVVRGNKYASTMCIGNMKSGTEHLARFIRKRKIMNLYTGLEFYGIILFFAVGAGFGGIMSGIMGIRAIWFSCGILLLAGLLMIRKE